jgi:hypothetical protein
VGAYYPGQRAGNLVEDCVQEEMIEMLHAYTSMNNIEYVTHHAD